MLELLDEDELGDFRAGAVELGLTLDELLDDELDDEELLLCGADGVEFNGTPARRLSPSANCIFLSSLFSADGAAGGGGVGFGVLPGCGVAGFVGGVVCPFSTLFLFSVLFSAGG